MDGFYIEDYIWLIVGGVFVLFVIIGFIADKTGLARKTFGKMPSSASNKKEVESIPVIEQPVQKEVTYIENPIEEVPLMEPIQNEEQPTNDTSGDNLYLNADDIYGNSDSIEPSISGESDNLYLNNEDVNDLSVQEQPVETSFSEEAIDNTGSDLNLDTDEDLYQPIGDVSFEEPKDEIKTDDSIDDVWQIDDTPKEDNETEIDLPALDELNAETDEDVWKF